MILLDDGFRNLRFQGIRISKKQYVMAMWKGVSPLKFCITAASGHTSMIEMAADTKPFFAAI